MKVERILDDFRLICLKNYSKIPKPNSDIEDIICKVKIGQKDAVSKIKEINNE